MNNITTNIKSPLQQSDEAEAQNALFKSILKVIDTLQGLCSMELKVKLQSWRILIEKRANLVKVANCRLVFDVTQGRIRVELQTPKLVSLATMVATPGALQTAIATLNTLLRRLPRCPAVTSRLFKRMLVTVLSTKLIGGGINDVTVPRSTLFESLSRIDLSVTVTRDITMEVRKKQWFSTVKRSKASLDLTQGLQLVKSPGNLLHQKAKEESIRMFTNWLEEQGKADKMQALREIVQIARSLII